MANENEIYEVNVDPGMEAELTADDVDMDNACEIVCDFVNGISMSANYKPEDLENIYNDIPDIESTILDVKKILFDLMKSSDEERDANTAQLMDVLGKFHADTGMRDLDYNIRDGISDYEKVIMMAMNMIILFTEMKHTAQLHHVNNDVNSLGHDLATLFDGLADRNPDELVGSFLDQIADDITEDETTGDVNKEEIENAE